MLLPSASAGKSGIVTKLLLLARPADIAGIINISGGRDGIETGSSADA
jgi:hypothetical protein